MGDEMGGAVLGGSPFMMLHLRDGMAGYIRVVL